MKRKLLLILLTFALCVPFSDVWAQVNVISGQVVDENGESLPGVTVLVENSTTGTTTDLDGNFTIGVSDPANTTLRFSFIGFANQKVKLGAANDKLSIILREDILSLDEVVVTGASIATSRKQLGNSIGTINAKEMKNTASVNPLAALSGRVLGAQVSQNQGDPAGGFSVRLRGVSTINGSSEPLYIIDGVIVDNSSTNVINLNADAMQTSFAAGQNRLVDINPNDIERIEVINGAAAAAIYGSRASNGVVQIFTKRGSDGIPKVTYSTSISISELRNRLDLNNEPIRFGIQGDERLSTTQDRLTTIADLRSAGDRAANPGTGPAALAGRPLVENTYGVTRYDYQDDLFRTAVGIDNYISVSGGKGDTQFFASASYLKNQGIIPNTDFQKYGARIRVDQKFGTKFKISSGLTYNNSFSHDKPNGNNFFSPISTMTIIDNVWDITERDPNGGLLHVEQQRVNPLSVLEEFDISQETNRIIADLQAGFYPIEGLSFDYVLGIDNYSLVGNTFQPRLPYAPVASSFFPDGYAAVATSNVFLINQDFTVALQKDFSDNITSTTTAGYQLQYNKNSFSAIEGRDLAGFVRTTEAITNFFNDPIEAQTERVIWGGFIQETLGFNDLFFLTLAGRLDAASSFGEDERNQFYPKVSGSLIVSDFDFWNNAGLANFWNTFKLRSSYGQAGNLTGIGAFDRFTNFDPSTLTGRSGFLQRNRLGDPNIKPEIMTEFEIGADMSFLNSRLGLQFTFYKQDIKDLILERGLAPTAGGSSIITNIGSMENKGIELMLNVAPIRNVNFSWDFSFLFNTFDNEVDGIGQGRAGVLLRGGGGAQSAIDGQSLGVFFARYYARNNDGSLLLTELGLPQVERGDDITGTPMRDANGQPDGDPLRKILGDPNPDYTWTLVNNISYKKFGLRFQFDAVQGFDVWNWDIITRNNVGSSPLAAQELRGELPRGWVAAIGGFIGPRIQEEHVEDGSFIKLRELALTYTLGKVGPIENLDIALIGRNLLSIDDYKGFDPETNSAGQSNRVRGDDFGNVPIPKTYQLKVTASF